MPIYEYACSNCHLRFEKIQKMSDPNITICPECNTDSVQKLISAPAFRLKGTGWYETDFKSPNETKRNLASDDSSNGGSSSVAATTQPTTPAPVTPPATTKTTEV